MYMTPGEICKEYNQAKFKKEQIAILADQNCCEKEDIMKRAKLQPSEAAAILHDEGLEFISGKFFLNKKTTLPPRTVIKKIKQIPKIVIPRLLTISP